MFLILCLHNFYHNVQHHKESNFQLSNDFLVVLDLFGSSMDYFGVRVRSKSCFGASSLRLLDYNLLFSDYYSFHTLSYFTGW